MGGTAGSPGGVGGPEVAEMTRGALVVGGAHHVTGLEAGGHGGGLGELVLSRLHLEHLASAHLRVVHVAFRSWCNTHVAALCHQAAQCGSGAVSVSAALVAVLHTHDAVRRGGAAHASLTRSRGSVDTEAGVGSGRGVGNPSLQRHWRGLPDMRCYSSRFRRGRSTCMFLVSDGGCSCQVGGRYSVHGGPAKLGLAIFSPLPNRRNLSCSSEETSLILLAQVSQI